MRCATFSVSLLKNVIKRTPEKLFLAVTVVILLVYVPYLTVAPGELVYYTREADIDTTKNVTSEQGTNNIHLQGNQRNESLLGKPDNIRTTIWKKSGDLNKITVQNLQVPAAVAKDKIHFNGKVSNHLTNRGKRKFKLIGRQDILKAEDCVKSLPDAIIIGVMKAGTEAFSTFLGMNPQIAMSFNVRSTLFFTSNYKKSLDWYRRQMTCKTARNQVTIEKAPQYFASPNAPKRIHSMNKDIKLILLLRNPIDRAVSHYLQVKNTHPAQIQGRSFTSMVFGSNGVINPRSGFIKLSTYVTILKYWLKHFHKSQILILNGDRLIDDPVKILSKAEMFLGVKSYIAKDKFVYNKSKGFYCLSINGAESCLGSGKGRKHPELSDFAYHKLRAYFRPFNQQLFSLIGKRFVW